MSLIARLAGFAPGEVGRHARIVVAGVIAAAAFSIVSLGFFGTAAFLVLTESLPPWGAALVVALATALLAAMASAIVAVLIRRAQRSVSRAVGTSALAAVAPPLMGIAMRHAGVASLLAVAGLGYLAMRKHD